jgi:hypothetical protein
MNRGMMVSGTTASDRLFAPGVAVARLLAISRLAHGRPVTTRKGAWPSSHGPPTGSSGQADSNFVGKALLLQWLNSNLQLKLEKVEDVSALQLSNVCAAVGELLFNQWRVVLPLALQTCNGAVACQLMDYLHPGSVNMKKVGPQQTLRQRCKLCWATLPVVPEHVYGHSCMACTCCTAGANAMLSPSHAS